MYPHDSGLEQRLSRFEAQLDRFSLALRQWQETQGQSPASPPDLAERIRGLEETITREALALRQLHEEPLKQLQGQAESLGDLSRSLQSLVTDLRMGAMATTSQGAAASWPLERVVDLHDELRRGASGGGSAHPEASLPEGAGPPSRRVRLLQAPGELDTASPHAIDSRTVRTPGWYGARAAAAAAALVMVVAGVWWIEARLDEASARVAAAERQVLTTTELANREVVAARQDADRQIAEARQLAQRAETVGVILTAPDLIRFNLTSGETVGPSAQLLWSRTRGLVLSGSRLPAAPAESTYQLWLVTSTQSIGAGLFVPDEAGRANLVVDAPPRVIGPVLGAAVTVEPTGGRPTPSGRTLLARIPRTEG
jgi:hypothetical protein